MAEVSNIRLYSNNRWYVWYRILAPCNCYYINRVLKIVQAEKPTTGEIDTAITDYEEKLKQIYENNNQR